MPASQDVVLLGDLLVDAQRLSALVADSRGQMLHQRGSGPCLGSALMANFSRCLGTSAVLDCYVSDGLRLVRVGYFTAAIQIGHGFGMNNSILGWAGAYRAGC